MTMKSKVIYPLLIYGLLSLFQQVIAQDKVRATGKVISTEGVAIPSATVEIVNTTNQQRESVSTDEEGIFHLTNVAVDQAYNIYVHHLGFQADSVMNFVAKHN